MGILRQKTLPHVEPIIPVARAKPFDDPAWLFEAKYDGFRGLLHVTWGGLLHALQAGHLLRRSDELCHWVRDELSVKDAMLDGTGSLAGTSSVARPGEPPASTVPVSGSLTLEKKDAPPKPETPGS